MANQYEELRYPKRIREPAQPQIQTPGKTTNAASISPAGSSTGGVYSNSGPFGQFAKKLDAPEPFHAGEALDKQIGDGSILSDDQRTRLLPYFIGRVDAALAAYLRALEKVQLAEVLKRNQQSCWRTLGGKHLPTNLSIGCVSACRRSS